MLHSLIAYDAAGNVVGTLDYVVAKNENGDAAGLVDFASYSDAGGRLRDVWEVSSAVGSSTWPEWLGAQAYDFQAELDPNPAPARARITALVHKKSGHRRVRADIEAAIAERINEKKAKARKQGDEIRRALERRGMSAEDVAQVQDPEPEPADLRDLLGGPKRPLLLDEDGKTKARQKRKAPDLPVVRRSPQNRT